MQGVLLNHLHESAELMRVLAPRVTMGEIVHPAIIVVRGCEVGVQFKVQLLRLVKQDLGPGS